MICECGKQIAGEHIQGPVKCSCGRWIGREPVCIHRGPSAGRASCGCGTVFLCDFYGGYCGDRAVVEFATIGSDTLTKENYRRCVECAEFSSR